jgi:membrane protease YdiL (CAAX protease family)
LALSPFIFVIPLLYVLRVDKWTSKDLGFTKPRSWAVLVFALLLFGYAGTQSLFTDPSRAPLSLPLVLIALFQPALTEELLFRGIIQRKLERALGQNKGWIYSGILFGLAHIAPDLMGAQWYDYGQNIGNMIGLLIQQIIVGWIFGIIYTKSKSLLPGFLAHFFTDWRLGSIVKLLFY